MSSGNWEMTNEEFEAKIKNHAVSEDPDYAEILADRSTTPRQKMDEVCKTAMLWLIETHGIEFAQKLLDKVRTPDPTNDGSTTIDTATARQAA